MIKDVRKILLTVGEEVETGKLRLNLEKYEKMCQDAKNPKIDEQLKKIYELIAIVPVIEPFYQHCMKYALELDVDKRDEYREELKKAIFEELKKYRIVEFV